MDRLLTLKTELLSLRKEMGVEERVSVPIVLGCTLFLRQIIDRNRDWFVRLAKVSEIRYDQNAGASHPELNWRFGTDFVVAVIYEKPIDVAAERERLTKDIAKYEKGLAAAERQLGNEAFLTKAPAQVVEVLKKQEAETRLLLEKAHAAFATLPKG
jgi:valyl-tRNA synthetase